MNNPTSFVVNTGTQEGDQHEIARYQQYYEAQGVVLAAQPQPQGGFLLTTYQPHQVGAAPKPAPAAQPDYAAAPKQDIAATQHGYAGPAQYGSSPPAGYGAAPQQYAAAAPAAPQQYAGGTQAGYGAAPQQYGAAPQQYGAAPQQYGAAPAAPQQYGAAMQAGYAAAPPQYAGAAQAAPQAYGAATQAGYGASPQQYAGSAQPDYGAPPQQHAASAQPNYGAPPQQYPGSAQPDYGAPQQYAGSAQPNHGASPQQYGGAAQPDYGASPQQYGGAAQPDYGASPQQYGGAAQPDYSASPQQYGGAAQAAYPQGSTPGYGASFPASAEAFGKPAARRSGLMGALGHFTLMQKLKAAGVAVFVLGLSGWSFFLLRQAQSNIVLFENSLDVAGELSLAGKTYGSISPRQALRLELDAGNYEVSFSGNGTKLDGGTLSVPKGNGATGYRAVYNLGGKKGIAVVTKYYGGSFEDTVKPVAEGTRVVEVPGAGSLDRLDEGFPDSVTVPKHQTFATLVHVCHVDEAKGTVGCPGW